MYAVMITAHKAFVDDARKLRVCDGRKVNSWCSWGMLVVGLVDACSDAGQRVDASVAQPASN